MGAADKFDCQHCGSCCAQIGKMVICCIATMDEAEKLGRTDLHPIVQEVAEFPFDILPDGSCSMYDKDNKICTIYETRPLICDVEKMYVKYWAVVMSREQWYSESKKSCLKLQEALNAPKQ